MFGDTVPLVEYATMAGKLFAGFIIILVYVRLSGKAQLAPMSATDQVGNMAIGGLIGTFVLNTSASLATFVFVLVVWTAFLLGLRLLKARSMRVKELVDGKRIQLVRDGRFLPDNFKRSHLSVRDFLSQMNTRNIANFDDLKSVWYEQNGQLSIVRNDEELLSIVVIEEGRVIEDQLAALGRDRSWLDAELAEHSVSDPSEVFCADYHDGRLWVYRY